MKWTTFFLYFWSKTSYHALNPRWKRPIRLIFLSFSSEWGFKKMAQRAGESVKAFSAEIPMEMAIVRPNWR